MTRSGSTADGIRWPAMIDEVRLVIPDLLEWSDQSANRYGPDPLQAKAKPRPDRKPGQRRPHTTHIPFRKAAVRPYKIPGRLEGRP